MAAVSLFSYSLLKRLHETQGSRDLRMNGEIRMNKERYSDPTAEQAIAHVMREYREKKKQEGGSSGKESERKGRESPKTIQKRNEAG